MPQAQLRDGLTFDDVLLVPGASSVHPNEVDLSSRLTEDIRLTAPIVSSPMDTVTEHRTAITLAREGGLGFVHKNLGIEAQAAELAKVKRSESGLIVDPITLEVARNRFSAMADEMGGVLRRTSLSPNIKERADCSAAVFTADGEMLAQAEHIPVHLGSMPESVAACIERFDPVPGAQYAVNDPFCGGTHLSSTAPVGLLKINLHGF